MTDSNSISALARTFCKIYGEHQEARLGGCYAAPSAIASAVGPSAPGDLAWWLASYNNALNASTIGSTVAAGSDEAASAAYGAAIDAMSFATCLVPEIASGNIQPALVSGELFLQWCRTATAVDPLFAMTEASLADPSIVLTAGDVRDIMSTIMRLANTHRFQHASRLLALLTAFIRKDAVIDARCEKAVSEVQSLLLNDFNSPTMFGSWQKKAQEYLMAASASLQPLAPHAEAPTVAALKADLLRLLTAFAGDAETAGALVGNVPSLHLAGVCAYIDPFMSYAALGQRALAIFSPTANPAAKASAGLKALLLDPSVAVIGTLLACKTLADVAAAMDVYSIGLEKLLAKQPKKSKSNSGALVGLLVAAHVADCAGPPFASPTVAGMKALVAANTAVERYVTAIHAALTAEEEGNSGDADSSFAAAIVDTTAYRMAAQYMCWRPLSNPSVMQTILASQVEAAEALLLTAEEIAELDEADANDENDDDDADEDEDGVVKRSEGAMTTARYAQQQIDAYVAALDDVADLLFAAFHSTSPLQARLRPIAAALCPAAAASVYSWWDRYVNALIAGTLRPRAAALLCKAGRYTELLIRSAATGSYSALRTVLERALRGRDALTHPAVLQCGEAINYGIVDIGAIAHSFAELAAVASAAAAANANNSSGAGACGANNTTSLNASACSAITIAAAADANNTSAAVSDAASTAAASEAADFVALLHMCSCVWGMTVGALTSGNAFGALLVAARRERQAEVEGGGASLLGGAEATDNATATAAAASVAADAATVALIDRPFVDAAASLVSSARRLAGLTIASAVASTSSSSSGGAFATATSSASSHHYRQPTAAVAAAAAAASSSSGLGFARLAHSVRFTLLQRLVNVLEALRLNPSGLQMAATAAFVFGADGAGVARASDLFALLIDLATSIDTVAFAEEGVGGAEEAEVELAAMTRSLVEMGRCW